VGIGKVYKNLMVDVQPTNEKLISRAENIVMKATDADRETAKKALAESDGKVKIAIIMILLDIDKDAAVKKLKESEGHVRKAL
jgi:N-acetylmuramic acid 6-phosphate etherase